MNLSSTFNLRDKVMVTVTVEEREEKMHSISIFVEWENKSEYAVKNYPCELENNACIWASTHDDETKLMVRILNDVRDFQNYPMCFEFYGKEGIGYLLYPKKKNNESRHMEHINLAK